MSVAPSTLRLSGLPKSKLNALRVQAKAAGISAEAYAKRLLEEAIRLEQQARSQAFDELYAVAQDRFRSSGVTERELDTIVDAARRRHHRRTSKKRA